MKTTILLVFLFCISASAQNFAVLLAKDNPAAPAGMPTNWPSLIQPLFEATELPEPYKDPWVFATKAQIEQWKTENASAMAAYLAAKDAAEAQPKRDRETAIKTALAELKLIRDSTGTLTGAQLSNAVRAISRVLIIMIHELLGFE